MADLEILRFDPDLRYLETSGLRPRCGRPNPRRRRARLLEYEIGRGLLPPIVRLMGLQATPDDPAAVEARGAATHFYDRAGAHDGRPRMAGRRLFLRRHRLLHGQLFGARI